jgi:hypothetical protein
MSKEKRTEILNVEEKRIPKSSTGRTKIVSGATYWNFEENPIFIGTYQGECHDNEGKLIGFFFIDNDNQEHIISNSYAIEKALNSDVEGTLVMDSNNVLEIISLGKSQTKEGKQFNRFDVTMLG